MTHLQSAITRVKRAWKIALIRPIVNT